MSQSDLSVVSEADYQAIEEPVSEVANQYGSYHRTRPDDHD
jgi:hypothetical protein